MVNSLLIASLLLPGAAPTTADTTPTRVLIIGTFHMASPGLDILNPSVKDILGERRQREILEVVSRLERFHPTKIALEASPDSPAIHKRLASYLAGRYTLTADEIDQLGLRLAKTLKQQTLYGIDFKEDLTFEAMFRYAEQNQQGALVQGVMSEVENKLKPRLSPDSMEKRSLRQILADLNSPEMDQLSHRLYMSLLRIGKGKAYAGTDVVAHWYDRNLRIATNIVRLAESPGERILVIIGSGHGKLLRQFIAETPGFQVVDCADYLK